MTAHNAEHEQHLESAALYVLGALDTSEREAFERHLEGCPTCADEVRSLRGVAQALPLSVTMVDPPPGLRAKVLATAGNTGAASATIVPMPVRQAARPAAAAGTSGWLAAAAMLLLAVGSGGYAWSLRGQIDNLQGRLSDALARLDASEAQVAVATRAVGVAEARMAVLTAPDMTQVNLAGQPVAPQATGRAFLSRSRGMVFTAANLPPLPAGRSYQLWIVTGTAPVSAGLLQLDSTGRVAQAFDTPPGIDRPVAVAVTIEPEGGVPAPTGDKYLVGLTS